MRSPADPDLAQETRHRFYDMAAAEKAVVVGFHAAIQSLLAKV